MQEGLANPAEAVIFLNTSKQYLGWHALANRCMPTLAATRDRFA